MKIKLVADSSANFHTLQEMEVAYAPLTIQIGDKEYVDDKDLDVTAMLSALRAYKGKTSSACPSVQNWIDAFDGADMVLGVAITSGLSGSYNSAYIAAKEYTDRNPEAKVFILDSLSTGPEMQLILEKYHELVTAGCDFETICHQIQEYSTHTHLLFSLESLDHFAKNGRVSPVIAKAAGILGIRITGRASAEGTLEMMHKCRGEQKAISQIYDDMIKQGYQGGKVRIAHSFNPDAANTLASMIRKTHPQSDITITENRGLCCYYAEEGGIIVGYEA
ncbi:MAG: DegV family protein [Lachnospiraceae bacterium]